MKNIVFIINSIGSGGAETALFNVIKGMPAHISEYAKVHLVLLDDEPQLKSIPSGVLVHQLDAKRSLYQSVVQCYMLGKLIKPDIVISFLVRANIVNSMLKMMAQYPHSIVCERMHLSSHLASQFTGVKRFFAACLPKQLYRKNSLVLGVSSGVSDDLIKRFNVPTRLVKTIYNPYDISFLKESAKQAMPSEIKFPEHFIVTVGRLTKSKDHVTLIRGFAAANTPYSLVIIGMGELQAELVSLSEQLGVQERVVFTAYVSNPHAIVARAEYFISTSLNEGFPNALMESMVLGKAVIHTSCEAGPAEILGEHFAHDAVNVEQCKHGILIPKHNEVAVKQAIELLANEDIRQRYSAQSLVRSQDFSLVEIANQYWQEIESLVKSA